MILNHKAAIEMLADPAVEIELLSLHEGNIARYRLRPSEFADWKSQEER